PEFGRDPLAVSSDAEPLRDAGSERKQRSSGSRFPPGRWPIPVGSEGASCEEALRGRAMRWPRMTARRWMIVIAVAAPDLALIVQRTSPPLAVPAFRGTMAFILLLPVMWGLLGLASED